MQVRTHACGTLYVDILRDPYQTRKGQGAATKSNANGATDWRARLRVRDPTMPLAVAVCITGQRQRTLVSMPVASSYWLHVVEAHRAVGHTVDTFLVVVGRWQGREHAGERKAIADVYAPTRLVLFEERGLDTLHLHCRPPRDRRYFSRLTQFIAIREAFRQLEAHELAAGVTFSWIYRTRTDLVYLAATPFAQAGLLEPSDAAVRSAVYVPAGVDDSAPSHACMNDMLFACPRALCRPHFMLLELFESPHCNLTACGRGCGSSGGPVVPPLPRGIDGPPRAPFALPTAPRHRGEWYAYARYSSPVGSFCPSDPRERPRLCCGPRLREVVWPLSLARPAHKTRHSSRRNVECTRRLAVAARSEHRAALHPFVAPCVALRAAWLARPDDTAVAAGLSAEKGALAQREPFAQLRAVASNASGPFQCQTVDLHTTCSRLRALRGLHAKM